MILENIEATPADCKRSGAVFLYPLRRNVVMKKRKVCKESEGKNIFQLLETQAMEIT